LFLTGNKEKEKGGRKQEIGERRKETGIRRKQTGIRKKGADCTGGECHLLNTKAQS